MKLTKEQTLGIIRHALTFAGGTLITLGLISEGMASEIIGGVMTLVGTLWSVINKQK